MKKVKFFGIIAILAVICISMSGCDFGGSLEIVNNTGETIQAQALSVGTIKDAFKTIENNKSYIWKFDLDDTVAWSWQYIAGISAKSESGKVHISGGEAKKIIAEK
jgi:hypothetical protein